MVNNKKTRERQFLNEFSTNYRDFPTGKIIDSESPDFLIKHTTGTIGIEIVDFVRGQNKGESINRRNEVLWQKIATEARKKFEAKFDIPLLVHFFWNDRYMVRQAEITQLAGSAVSLIEKCIPEKLFKSVRIGYDELDGTLLERVCHSITVCKVRNEKQSLWSFVSSGWTEVQTNEIQYLLDSKNDKVPDYLQSCDTVWLIIVADGRYISSNIDITGAAISQVYKTLFEKVFVYDRISKGVFLLRLE